MNARTHCGWLIGTRVVLAAIIAVATVSIAAPAAEAKKPSVDPNELTSTFLADLADKFDGLDGQASDLLNSVSDDIAAAVETGKLKKVLKINQNVDKILSKNLKAYAKFANKGLSKVTKTLAKSDADPALATQVQNAVNLALTQLQSTSDGLRQEIGNLVDDAVTQLQDQSG